MSAEERAALLTRGVIARLGCLDDEGYPYVVPVWFEYADGGFYIIPRERSAWARFLQRDGRVSLCIEAAEGDGARVLVKGTAELIELPNVGGRWVEIAHDMAVRYMGAENGPRYFETTQAEPRWLFFVRPQRLTDWVGGWAGKYKHADW
jgi:nitroimidazol reductase NimA-like FMN-containing flavoprotein (pyridoxamine 5'-phosphate oxidase superfamily)